MAKYITKNSRIKNWINSGIGRWTIDAMLIIVFSASTWYFTSKEDQRNEQLMRESQMGWFEAVGNVTLVDTFWLHPDLTDSVQLRPGINLGEVIPILNSYVMASLNITFVNRGTEAARIDLIAGDTPQYTRKRILWDSLLEGHVEAKAFDIDLTTRPIVQPKESTKVSIPINISDIDSSGRAFGHIAIVTESVPHRRFALTYLWLDIKDPYRKSEGLDLYYYPLLNVIGVPKYECKATIIDQNLELINPKTEADYLNAFKRIHSDSIIMRNAEMRLRTHY
jgi:hypothetical protein